MEYRPKPIPPLYFLVCLALMALLHHLVPLARLFDAPLSYLGALPLVVGLGMSAFAVASFTRAETPVVPFARTTAIVTTGLYRFTRNPMYLGMVLALAGVAILLGSLSAIFPIPVFIWLLHVQFIRREEMFLEELFGEEYLSYKARVRRWL